jgi:hypothetical protein
MFLAGGTVAHSKAMSLHPTHTKLLRLRSGGGAVERFGEYIVVR